MTETDAIREPNGAYCAVVVSELELALNRTDEQITALVERKVANLRETLLEDLRRRAAFAASRR